MIIRSLLYSVGIYVLAFIIAMLVGAIIIVIYKIVHRGEKKDNGGKTETNQVSQ